MINNYEFILQIIVLIAGTVGCVGLCIKPRHTISAVWDRLSLISLVCVIGWVMFGLFFIKK